MGLQPLQSDLDDGKGFFKKSLVSYTSGKCWEVYIYCSLSKRARSSLVIDKKEKFSGYLTDYRLQT